MPEGIQTNWNETRSRTPEQQEDDRIQDIKARLRLSHVTIITTVIPVAIEGGKERLATQDEMRGKMLFIINARKDMEYLLEQLSWRREDLRFARKGIQDLAAENRKLKEKLEKKKKRSR